MAGQQLVEDGPSQPDRVTSLAVKTSGGVKSVGEAAYDGDLEGVKAALDRGENIEEPWVRTILLCAHCSDALL
jgi:hypothetical protein